MVLWVVLSLFLVMVMVDVVWILGQPTFIPRSMIRSNKYRSYYSFSLKRGDHFCVAVDGRGGVGHRTTYFSSQKVYLSADSHDAGFGTYQSHCTASPMLSPLGRGYSYNATGGYSFGVAAIGGKVVWVLVPPTFLAINLIFVLVVVIFFSHWSRYYISVGHSNRYSSYYSLSQMWHNHFSVSGDGIGVVGTRTTLFSSHKVGFGGYRHDMEFSPYQSHRTGSPVYSSFSKYY